MWTQRHPAAFGIETCGSRASFATLALPRRLEAVPDGKWTCGEQLDKFRGPFSAFASSWTELAQADKLKGRQCISLFEISIYCCSPVLSLHLYKTQCCYYYDKNVIVNGIFNARQQRPMFMCVLC